MYLYIQVLKHWKRQRIISQKERHNIILTNRKLIFDNAEDIAGVFK